MTMKNARTDHQKLGIVGTLALGAGREVELQDLWHRDTDALSFQPRRRDPADEGALREDEQHEHR